MINETFSFLTSPKLWLSIMTAGICLVIWLVLKRWIRSYLSKKKLNGRSEINLRFGVTIIKYLIALIGLVAILQIFEINVSGLVTGLGIAGIVVGFALQDILKDFIMGINIVWDEFFAVGDMVKYNDIEGRVVYYNIKVTKIYDIATGNTVTISNRNISEIAKESDWLDVIIPASYEVKAEKMREICKELCSRIEEKEHIKGCEFLGTEEFADSLIKYKIRIHCSPAYKKSVNRMVLGMIQDIYEEHGLSVPYPQLDIHQK